MALTTIGIYALFAFVDLQTVYSHDQRKVLAAQHIECIVLDSIEIIRVGNGSEDRVAFPIQETTTENWHWTIPFSHRQA